MASTKLRESATKHFCWGLPIEVREGVLHFSKKGPHWLLWLPYQKVMAKKENIQDKPVWIWIRSQERKGILSIATDVYIVNWWLCCLKFNLFLDEKVQQVFWSFQAMGRLPRSEYQTNKGNDFLKNMFICLSSNTPFFGWWKKTLEIHLHFDYYHLMGQNHSFISTPQVL